MKTSLLKSKKFRYGASGTALTVAFIAVVVILNIIITALGTKYMWFVDMTEEKIFTLSENAKEILSDVTEDVHIYFAAEPDELEASTASRYIYTTAKQLDESFTNISVECVDVLKNPAFFRPFYETAATDIDSTSVVITSGKEVSVLRQRVFFTYDDETDLSTAWAYNGEKKFVSAILQVTRSETPKVAFTASHGEDISSAIALASMFAENGYEVDAIDLTKNEIDEDCRIVVIYNPIYDFVGAEAEDAQFNEIEKIDSFLDGYGCLLVFCDPEYVSNLTNLNEFLAEWGISYVADTTVRDMEHSMSVDGYSIIGEYVEGGAGGLYLSDINSLSARPRAIIRKSAPIDILWSRGGELNATREVSPMLRSYPSSELVVNGNPTESGAYNLLTVSREQRIVNNEYYYSYVIAAGSPTFASQAYIVSNSYANEDILSASMTAMGKDRVLADLKFKPFDDSSITVTTADANRWTVAMTAVLPVIFALLGIVVVTKRKHQ